MAWLAHSAGLCWPCLYKFRGANSLQWGYVLDDTWNEVRENLGGHVLTNIKDLTDMKECVRHWLYNHSGNKEPRNKVAGHVKYLGQNQVLNGVKKKEVEKRMWDLYGVKPGQSGYIGKLQSVLKVMLTELSKEELAELKEKHNEWYIDGPSEGARQK
ncbi:hypothetical protein SERLADRAFT_405889 [Serpula lacrymans var. lacrymans S7.9]|uniref:Uncharacterized protein n=1 Tax=Serpula lacrymans var. lacrymans (strain S7.9) TaxID=578457 RepID=F8NJR8_SERL9|nr:uncharacterized protein SERLADRAFT_405889 [Serpula lacrymans var. lacrymans S7.9]EGO28283.1 hypothetical protein SERLADRAFT_405889 [Serpula lacrymans var. lacrymans S7.9]